MSFQVTIYLSPECRAGDHAKCNNALMCTDDCHDLPVKRLRRRSRFWRTRRARTGCSKRER